MYILRTGMLQHELPVGQRIEDMVEIFIQTEHGCNVIHCAGGPLLFHNGAQIRIDRSKCAGIECFQTDMGFQNFAQVAGLLHLLAVDQADKELVGALRFFADPEMSGYITGQVIAVDGGFLSCPGI